MSSGFWYNNDDLPLQYGTQKANPKDSGEFLSYGNTRIFETLIDLTSLTTTASIVDLNAIFPTGGNVYVEKIEVIADTASATGTSFSVGLGYIASGPSTSSITYTTETATASAYGTTTYTETYPTPTSISDTAFINALTNSNTNTAGDYVTINQTTNATYVGAYVGAVSSITHLPAYITAKSAGSTYTSGLMRVRIFYRGYGTIVN